MTEKEQPEQKVEEYQESGHEARKGGFQEVGIE